MVIGVTTTRARHGLPACSIPVLGQRLLVSQGLVIDVAHRPRVRSRNRGHGPKALTHAGHTRAADKLPSPPRRGAIRAGPMRAEPDQKNDEPKQETPANRY